MGEAKGQGENGDWWAVRTSSCEQDWGLVEEEAAQGAERAGCGLILARGPTRGLTFREGAPFHTLDQLTNSLPDSTEDTGNRGENRHL